MNKVIGFRTSCEVQGIAKPEKENPEYERKNTEKDSGTRFAWVFVWQRNFYYSRGNENHAKPRGHSGTKSINSKTGLGKSTL